MADSHPAIRQLFNQGDLFDAYDRIRAASTDAKEDADLLELQARAEERLGLDDRLEQTLDRLEAQRPDSEELHGFRGKLNKRRAHHTTGDEQRAFWREALKAYQQGYDLTGGYWTGINVATLQYLLGERAEAEQTAQVVQEEVEALLPRQDPDSVDALWSLGTLGDALLIQGRVPEALARYESLRDGAVRCDALETLFSVRRNARRILEQSDVSAVERAQVEHVLHSPRLAVCVGHMTDRPDRDSPRFPDSSEIAVADALGRLIDAEDVRFGISSLAAGADILFQEALAKRGLSRHVVLPFPADRFQEASVSPEWRERFDAMLDADRHSQIMQHRIEACGLEFELANRFIEGLVQIRADQLGADVLRIAVWNGEPGDGRGGTADVVQMWRSIPGARIAVIDPMDGRVRVEQVGSTPETSPVNSEVEGFARCALLFADAQGFSKFDEEQVHAFVQVFLGGLATIIHSEKYRGHVRARNTWGDAIFLALDDIHKAGELALDLRDFVHAPAQRAAFRAAGLPDDLDLRIALHAAVVRLVQDPVSDVRRVAGTQVSHAARIEPITPVGEVYASDAFAALSRTDLTAGEVYASDAFATVSRAESETGFRCDYVGRTLLAKNFGTFPTYHVRRS